MPHQCLTMYFAMGEWFPSLFSGVFTPHLTCDLLIHAQSNALHETTFGCKTRCRLQWRNGAKQERQAGSPRLIAVSSCVPVTPAVGTGTVKMTQLYRPPRAADCNNVSALPAGIAADLECLPSAAGVKCLAAHPLLPCGMARDVLRSYRPEAFRYAIAIPRFHLD